MFGLVTERKNLGSNFSEGGRGALRKDTLFFTLDTETDFLQFEEQSHDSSINIIVNRPHVLTIPVRGLKL